MFAMPDRPLLLAVLNLALTYWPGHQARLPAKGSEIEDSALLKALQREMNGAGCSYHTIPDHEPWRAGWTGGWPDPEPRLYLIHGGSRERQRIEPPEVLDLAREVLGISRPGEGEAGPAAPAVAIQERLW